MDQSATPVAVEIQNLLLEARLSRARTTIVGATSLMIGRVQASGEASVVSDNIIPIPESIT